VGKTGGGFCECSCDEGFAGEGLAAVCCDEGTVVVEGPVGAESAIVGRGVRT